jgi:predicted nucleic acid-binding protein
MKNVHDANIYVPAFLWGGNPAKVFQRALAGTEEIYVIQAILDEIQDVLSRPKFHLEKAQIDFYIDLISNEYENIKIVTAKEYLSLVNMKQ